MATNGLGGHRPPGEGVAAQTGQARVGDRVSYRDQQAWLDGFVLAAQASMNMAMVGIVGHPQLLALPLDKLVVLERGALLRTIQLN